MKWQMIPRYAEKTITVKHYRLFKLFGARLHHRLELDCYEFRLAYFTIVHTHSLFQGLRIEIPIPFMKDDHGIGWY